MSHPLRPLVVMLAVAWLVAGCGEKVEPRCEGGKRCGVGYRVSFCVRSAKHPNDCADQESRKLTLACHDQVLVKGEPMDVRDYCEKDPTYVAPVTSWSERFEQAGAIFLGLIMALFTGARARSNSRRKRELGIYED